MNQRSRKIDVRSQQYMHETRDNETEPTNQRTAMDRDRFMNDPCGFDAEERTSMKNGVKRFERTLERKADYATVPHTLGAFDVFSLQ